MTKKGKSKFVTKSLGIIVMIISMYVKISLKLLVKLLLQCFFTDHLNHKTVIKTTCRAPSAYPRQLWAH